MTWQNIVSGVIGALVGSFFVHFLAISRERGNRVRIFRGFIQSLLYELEAINTCDVINSGNPDHLCDWHKNLMVSLRVECARATQNIRCPKRRAELSDLLKQFSAQGKRDTSEQRYQPHIERVSVTLSAMMKCAR